MSVSSSCMYVYHVHAWYLRKSLEGISYEVPCGCWGLNPGPLQEQPGLSTAEAALQNSLLQPRWAAVT